MLVSVSPPRPSHDLLRASWISARAFTPNRAAALLAVPCILLALLPPTLRGGLYLDKARTGMVVLHPRRLRLDVTISTAFWILWNLVALTVVTSAALNVLVWLSILQGTGVIVVAGSWFLRPPRGTSIRNHGPETPPGPRWEMGSLAQLPGTRLTALQTARRVLREVPPPGAVIVASADSDRLLRAYVRAGFLAGPKRRVHMVVPDEPPLPRSPTDVRGDELGAASAQPDACQHRPDLSRTPRSRSSSSPATSDTHPAWPSAPRCSLGRSAS